MLKTDRHFVDLDEYTYLKNCYQFVTFAYLWYEIFTRMTEQHTASECLEQILLFVHVLDECGTLPI